MCNAFCCLITKSKKVYWKVGVDSHDQLQEMFVKKDKELRDDKESPKDTFARIEVTPQDGNYFNLKQKWVFKIDEQVKPEWLDNSYQKPCYEALRLWQKQVYSQIDLKGLKHPLYPFKIKPPKRITTRHLKLLAKWDSVGDLVWVSVGASVEASVRDSLGASAGTSVWDSFGASAGTSVWDLVWGSFGATVWDSLGASVWDSFGNSVWDSFKVSVWDSVRAYFGTFFPKIKKWKYCQKVKEKGYPFKSAVNLWKMGLVASYNTYDEKWRLHGGSKVKVLWEGTKADLRKYLPEGWK